MLHFLEFVVTVEDLPIIGHKIGVIILDWHVLAKIVRQILSLQAKLIHDVSAEEISRSFLCWNGRLCLIQLSDVKIRQSLIRIPI